jgi:hypothetical protein
MIKYLLLLLLWSGTANAMCLKPTANAGATADIVTTILGIYHYGLSESNPLGLVGSTAVKVISLTHITDASKEKQQEFNNTAGAFWSGAAVNNAMVILGVSNPGSIMLGLVSAMIFYNMPNCEKKND